MFFNSFAKSNLLDLNILQNFTEAFNFASFAKNFPKNSAKILKFNKFENIDTVIVFFYYIYKK